MNETRLLKPGRRQLARTGLALGAAALAPGAGRAASDAPTAAPARSTGPIVLQGASPRLTMHALDIFHGTPATGLRADLSMFDGRQYALLRTPPW